MSEVVIGIDAGTSVIKAVAFSRDGRQLALASRPNSYVTLANGGVEQDMARTWADTAAVLAELAGAEPGLASRTAAIAVTGQGDGTWLIDAAGEPVAPAWLWLDGRAADIVAEINDTEAGREIYEITGTGLNACQQRFQLLWMARHAPELLKRCATALHCKDWLYFRLSGERATDPAEAIFTFGDFRTRAYSDRVLEALGLSSYRRLLPEIVDGTGHYGRLTAEAARATGFAEGTPVVLGYLDTVCTGLGGGLLEPTGQVGCTVIGSTAMNMRLLSGADAAPLNEARTGYIKMFPAPGMLAQMQSSMSATLNLDWLADLARSALGLAGVEFDRREILVRLQERVLDAPAGAALYHPYIHRAGERGPFLDPHARASFLGFDTTVDLAALTRAVLEGLALASRDCYCAMGPLPEEIRLVGGAARSVPFRRIFASVLGVPVRTIASTEPGAAGAAMIAATSLGLYPSTRAAAERWIDPLLSEPQAPDPALVGVYERLFKAYHQSRSLLPPIWQSLAAIRKGA